jgi:hypothetical protein
MSDFAHRGWIRLDGKSVVIADRALGPPRALTNHYSR